MSLDPLTAGMELIGKAIDRFVPDPAQRDAAKLAMYQAQRDGDMEGVKVQMSAILAEANSADPWTSRARPSFMYVMYTLMLASIPMGVLHAFTPDTSAAITVGFRAWLDAIPAEMLALFGVGYVGYAVSRTQEKIKGRD